MGWGRGVKKSYFKKMKQQEEINSLKSLSRHHKSFINDSVTVLNSFKLSIIFSIYLNPLVKKFKV